MKSELIYTVSELATIMKLNTSTVYKLIKKGDIPYVRVGRSIRIPIKKIGDILETI